MNLDPFAVFLYSNWCSVLGFQSPTALFAPKRCQALPLGGMSPTKVANLLLGVFLGPGIIHALHFGTLCGCGGSDSESNRQSGCYEDSPHFLYKLLVPPLSTGFAELFSIVPSAVCASLAADHVVHFQFLSVREWRAALFYPD